MVNPDLPPPSPLGPARWKALQTGQMRMWCALFPSPQTAAPQEGQGRSALLLPSRTTCSRQEGAGEYGWDSWEGTTPFFHWPALHATEARHWLWQCWQCPPGALAALDCPGPVHGEGSTAERQTQGSQGCCCYPSPAAKLLEQGGTRVLTPAPDCGSGGRMCQGAGAGGRAESSESLLEVTGITGHKVPGSWNLGAVSKTQEVWGKTVGKWLIDSLGGTGELHAGCLVCQTATPEVYAASSNPGVRESLKHWPGEYALKGRHTSLDQPSEEFMPRALLKTNCCHS